MVLNVFYLYCGTCGLDREARHFPLCNEENNSLHFCSIFHLISWSSTVFPVKNNYHCDVCYKNVSICHTGNRWVRILELHVESRYLNSSFCILTLMPFFLHWTYQWGILVSITRSQSGVLWFLSPPPAPSLPLPSIFWRKIMSETAYGKSPQIVTCGSEVLESVPVPETFLVPLYPHYFSQLARQMPSASRDLVAFLVYQ